MNLSRGTRERPFRTLFTCAARCGTFPIRKPPLAKDAKFAKKFWVITSHLAPFAFFAREFLRKPAPTCHAERVNGLFGPFFTCAARCGSFPIQKPPLAKDAKFAKKFWVITSHLAPFAIFAREFLQKPAPTCHAKSVNGPNLSRGTRERPFRTLFTCAARCGTFPIRKPPLAKDAKFAKKFWVITSYLAPFAIFARECLGKRPGNAVLKAFWPLDRLSAALVRAAGRCVSCFGAENPLFSLKIGKFDRKSTQMAPDGPRQTPTASCRPLRSIVDLPGASCSVNILPPAERLCAFDPRGSFQRAEIIDYRTDPFRPLY